MNCKECRRLLEDFHDGELSENRADEVRSHLGTCAACTADLRILESEHALFERYREHQANEAAASAPGWEALHERISRIVMPAARTAEATGRGWFRFLAGSPLVRQAIYATLLVALSVAGTLIMVRRNHPASPEQAASVPAQMQGKVTPASNDTENVGLDSAMRAVRRAEQEYIQAIELLNEMVNRRKPSLDPRLVREIESNLKSIDESIAATRRAYYERPSDAELALYMLAAYSKKVELLQELVT